jgi:hypothetical protein
MGFCELVMTKPALLVPLLFISKLQQILPQLTMQDDS